MPSDTKSRTSKENDPEVKFPEFTLYECDLVYSFEEPSIEMVKHMKTLFIITCLNGVLLNRVLVDNGAAVNIIPLSTLKKINKYGSKLVQTHIRISKFIGDKKDTKGVLPIETIVGLSK